MRGQPSTKASLVLAERFPLTLPLSPSGGEGTNDLPPRLPHQRGGGLKWIPESLVLVIRGARLDRDGRLIVLTLGG